MAPVVWGLDLSEIRWAKFKSSYMWNGDYHLRRTKFIVYQCALIFCVVSESLGTAVLSDYVQGQKKVGKVTNHHVYFYNNDYVGAASYNIFAGIFVAFVFGAAFFFDLFWPERKESTGVRIAWKVCGILACLIHLASALTMTVITARHSSHVKGHGADRQDYWWSQFKKHGQDPLSYSHNPRAIAAVVFAWLGFCSVVPSCILLFLSINDIEHGPGPKSRLGRERDAMHTKPSDPEMAEKRMEATTPAQRSFDDLTYPAPTAEQRSPDE